MPLARRSSVRLRDAAADRARVAPALSCAAQDIFDVIEIDPTGKKFDKGAFRTLTLRLRRARVAQRGPPAAGGLPEPAGS